MRKKLLITALLVMLPGTAFALECNDDSIASGKKVYKKCKICHNLNKEKKKVGPHLVGLFGRKAAATEKYKYSKAMKAKAEEGLMWNEETLNEFLTKPKKFIPKTKMAFGGVKKDEKRNALLCYIKSVNDAAS